MPASDTFVIVGGLAGVPYFYTDQYDLGMEYVGYADPGGYRVARPAAARRDGYPGGRRPRTAQRLKEGHSR